MVGRLRQVRMDGDGLGVAGPLLHLDWPAIGTYFRARDARDARDAGGLDHLYR